MPLYDFKCPHCKKDFESISKPHDPVQCPECKTTPCERLVALPAPHVWSGSTDGAMPKKRT